MSDFLKHTVNLIQEVNRQVPQIKSAPRADKFPADLLPDLMPLVLPFPDEASTIVKAGFRHQTREFALDTFIAPAGGTLETAPPIEQAMDILNVLANTWFARINDAEDYVLDYGEQSGYRVELNRNEPIRDSGWLMDMEWRPKEYFFGFRLWLPLMVRWGSQVGI